MAKRKASQSATDPTLSRGSQRLFGTGFFLVGALIVFVAITASRGEGEARARAFKEQAFVQAKCSIEKAEARTNRDAEGSEHTILSVTFTVPAGNQMYSGVTYEYPDYAYTKASAEQGLKREFAPGAWITCFYDKENPNDAVLMRKAAPTDEPTNPLMGWMFGAIGVIFAAVGIHVIFSKKKWKAYSDNDYG